MTHEQELVLELCKFEQPDGERIQDLLAQKPDMPYVLGQLLFNRMGGAAYYVLKKLDLLGKVNREFRNTLDAIYSSNCGKARALQASMADMAEALAGLDIRYAALKGAYLVSVYPVGIRTSNDIDLLLNKKDVGRISTRLSESGFKQGSIKSGVFVPATREEILTSKMTRGETVPFIRETGQEHMKYLEIDLNFSLDYQARNVSMRVDSFLDRVVPEIHTEKGNLFTLSMTDFIIHLCAHLYKEATLYPWVEMGRDLTLYKFADLYLLSARGHFDEHDDLVYRIRELGMEQECYYALCHTATLFGIQNPALFALLERIKPENTVFMKQIYMPSEQKTFSFDMDYTDWFFCKNRAGALTEV